MKSWLFRENIYFILLLLVLISATIGYKINGFLIIILSCFYFFDKLIFKKIQKLKSIVPFLFFAYFLFHILGYFYSENKLLAIHEIEVKLSFLVLPLIIFSEKISKNKIDWLFKIFKCWLIIWGIILMAYKLLKVGGPIATLASYSVSDLTNIHHSYFSLFYVFGFCYSLYQIKKSNTKKIFLYLELFFFIFFISVLGARVTSIFVFILLLLFLIQKTLSTNRLNKFIILFSFLFLSFLVLKYSFIGDKIQRLSKVEWNIQKNIYNHQVFSFDYDDKTSNTLELRLIKWYAAIQIVKNNPFFGVGSGDYLNALVKEYHKLDFKKGMVYNYNTHNQFLEEFIKFGYFGGVFFLLFFLKLIYDCLTNKNRLLLHILFILILFLLVESAFNRQHGVFFASFFIPILYIYHTKPEFTIN